MEKYCRSIMSLILLLALQQLAAQDFKGSFPGNSPFNPVTGKNILHQAPAKGPENLHSGSIPGKAIRDQFLMPVPDNPSLYTRWNWDTIVVQDTAHYWLRASRTYDSDGRVLTELRETNLTGVWTNLYRVSYQYNPARQVTLDLYEEWQGGSWTNGFRETYTYSTDGYLLSYFSEDGNMNQWTNYEQIFYTYYPNGNLETRNTQQWDGTQWAQNVMYTNTYDDSSNLVSTLTQVMVDSVWYNSYFNTYEYLAGGKLLSHLYQYWWSGVLTKGRLDSYTYDERGLMNTNTYQIWRDSVWFNNSRQIYSYNDNGRLLTRVFAPWNSSAGNFIPSWRYTATYDEHSSLVMELEESVDTGTTPWINVERHRYVSDANGNSTSCIYEKWDGSGWKPGMGPLYVFAQQDTVNYFLGFYQYQASFVSYTTGMFEHPGQDGLKIFPDPAASQISLETGAAEGTGGLLTLLDMKGRVVMTRNVSGPLTFINISMLPPSEYIVRLQQQGRILSGRFLKKGN